MKNPKSMRVENRSVRSLVSFVKSLIGLKAFHVVGESNATSASFKRCIVTAIGCLTIIGALAPIMSSATHDRMIISILAVLRNLIESLFFDMQCSSKSNEMQACGYHGRTAVRCSENPGMQKQGCIRDTAHRFCVWPEIDPFARRTNRITVSEREGACAPPLFQSVCSRSGTGKNLPVMAALPATPG